MTFTIGSRFEKLSDPDAARTAFRHEIKAIASAAKAEDRDLTDDEKTRTAELEQFAKNADDQSLARDLKAWGEKLGQDDRTPQTGTRFGGKGARGFGPWGDAVVKRCSDTFGRFKDLAPSGGAPVTVPVNPEPIREGEPLITMRQLIPSENNTTGAFAYLRQTERVNAAAAVAVGDLKPTSRYSTERFDDTVRVIAHLTEPLDRSMLSDAPLLERFVDTELQLGLDLEIERLILRGTGAGAEFTGLDHTSGVQVQPWTESLLMTTRTAITKLEMFGLAPTGWVFNPIDWARIEMSSNDFGFAMTQAGQALPIERAARRLWGLPVAVSASQPAGTGWLANWQELTLHVREDARVDWSEGMYRPDALGTGKGATDFARNLIAFRCEARIGLAIHRPMGIVELQLTGP